MSYYLLNTDGGMASDGHREHHQEAGEAAIGVVLRKVNKNSGKEALVKGFGELVGRKMNDVAEYEALIKGLETALEEKATHVRAFMDSEFVVEQVNNERTPNEEDLVPLNKRVHELIEDFAAGVGFRLSWVPRGRNGEADDLARRALATGGRVELQE